MGFGDFLFNNFNPDERSRRNEARQEAKEYRQEAKEILQDAKDLESDYKELKSDARRAANSLGDLVKSHNDYKVKILKELGTEITNTIDNFKRFNIDSHVINVPNISSGSMPNIPSFSPSSFTTFMPGGDFNPISLIFSSMSDPYKDRDKALDEKYAAQDYYYKVQDAVNEVRDVIERLRSTRRFIEEEKSTISQLMDKIRSIINQLNTAMDKQFHTQSEAKHMKAICNIAEFIKKTLEEQVINKSGDVAGNYRKYSQQLKKINDAIPSRPVISSSNSWIDIIQY